MELISYSQLDKDRQLNTHITTKSHILVYSSDDASRQFFESSLVHLVSYEVEFRTFENFLNGKDIGENEYDLIIVDLANGSTLGTSELDVARTKLSKYPFIFVSETLDKTQMRHLIRLEGSDWLEKPLQPRTLIEAIQRTETNFSAKTKQNLVHAVVSSGGGAGGTSVAIMFAHNLSRPRKRITPTVALFDLDFSTAAAGAYLNLENSYSLGKVLSTPERIDLEFLDVVKKRHESGFSLFSFNSPEIYETSKGTEIVLRILDVAAFQNNHTVLDIPSSNTAWNNKILSGVDTLTLVTLPLVPCLNNTKRMLNKIREIIAPNTPVTIIVNKVKKGVFGRVAGQKEIKEIFADTDIILLPNDEITLNEALNQGELPIEVNARSGFCKGLGKLSEKLKKTEGVFRS